MTYQSMRDEPCLSCGKGKRRNFFFCEKCLTPPKSTENFDIRLRIIMEFGLNKRLDRLRRGTAGHGV